MYTSLWARNWWSSPCLEFEVLLAGEMFYWLLEVAAFLSSPDAKLSVLSSWGRSE